jgi:2-desacetyl-2-hydroxyethyl bacteriochlorophyllide A dehydrogenase
MPQAVSFVAPRTVSVVETEAQPLLPGTVRVRTWYSGISAGTELTAYRGSNPYLRRGWDPRSRAFREGAPAHPYPIVGWGYSEVGEVVEVAPAALSPAGEARGAAHPSADGETGAAGVAGLSVDRVSVGETVFGIWGHRSEAVLPAEAVQPLDTADPIVGCFARPGAIALNAVLAGEVHLGDRVAAFGQGVIGLLATRLATLSGADVIAVEGIPRRRERARAMGAVEVLDPSVADGAGAVVRAWCGDGADAALELSGNVRALHEAIRAVAVEGIVVAAGFYQGGAADLRLGEEFHHNRVRIVASQVSGTPVALGRRWNQRRLVSTFMRLVLAGRVDAASLVTDVTNLEDVGDIYARLDDADPDVLQAVLRFDAAPRGTR